MFSKNVYHESGNILKNTKNLKKKKIILRTYITYINIGMLYYKNQIKI